MLPKNTYEKTDGAIIVEWDEDVRVVRDCLNELTAAGQEWPCQLRRVVSLETAKRHLKRGDTRFARLEQWPEPSSTCK